ncbi:hypothetical protein PHMEG_00012614 [Phytophthora megakarya]|uniref:RxLR effector protein n=1 Tax=Phytophthora megakarya TaxID=4795 RepID=A0A225W8B5_9STRA|nr:hypothetical protein PHMEG_00012614 [Phytophthora megakarya]
MFLTLKMHLDDETLAKIKIAAKPDSRSDIKLYARNLEKAEFEQWLSSGKKSDDVFKLLKLNDETGSFLTNSAFYTWAMYITKMDNENPYHLVLAKLLTRYDEASLAKPIYAARRDPSIDTAVLAGKLKTVQMKYWVAKGNTPDDVFKLLSLHKVDGLGLLKSDMLRVWESYVFTVHQNPIELHLKELKVHNKDDRLANMLVMAKQDARAFATADGLEVLLQKHWIDKRKTAVDVFKLMNLVSRRPGVVTKEVSLLIWKSKANKLAGLG